ncbi:MAG: S-layer homology domain-containing protein [Clostridiales bacterium]|jgi:hypothetical protein|nr:S-layer homology domain-containing protein [Clostridiales bacterium]
MRKVFRGQTRARIALFMVLVFLSSILLTFFVKPEKAYASASMGAYTLGDPNDLVNEGDSLYAAIYESELLEAPTTFADNVAEGLTNDDNYISIPFLGKLELGGSASSQYYSGKNKDGMYANTETLGLDVITESVNIVKAELVGLYPSGEETVLTLWDYSNYIYDEDDENDTETKSLYQTKLTKNVTDSLSNNSQGTISPGKTFDDFRIYFSNGSGNGVSSETASRYDKNNNKWDAATMHFPSSDEDDGILEGYYMPAAKYNSIKLKLNFFTAGEINSPLFELENNLETRDSTIEPGMRSDYYTMYNAFPLDATGGITASAVYANKEFLFERKTSDAEGKEVSGNIASAYRGSVAIGGQNFLSGGENQSDGGSSQTDIGGGTGDVDTDGGTALEPGDGANVDGTGDNALPGDSLQATDWKTALGIFFDDLVISNDDNRRSIGDITINIIGNTVMNTIGNSVGDMPNSILNRYEHSLTRADVAVAIYERLQLKGGGGNGAFYDVDANAWYAKAINGLENVGIIKGYGDGTFRPNSIITLEEYIALISRAVLWSWQN